MCGKTRIRLSSSFFSSLGIPRSGIDIQGFPGQNCPIILVRNRLFMARWGYGDDPRFNPINARLESLESKSFWREARTCIVPVSEFYDEGYWISSAQDEGITLAGVYTLGHRGLSFAIVTTNSYGEVERIHDRMPLIVDPNQWLEKGIPRQVKIPLKFSRAI